MAFFEVFFQSFEILIDESWKHWNDWNYQTFPWNGHPFFAILSCVIINLIRGISGKIVKIGKW